MYERILSTRISWKGDEKFEVLSVDMRDVLFTCFTMTEAKQFLERQVKLERSQCSTGSCED